MSNFDKTCDSVEERRFLNYYKDLLKQGKWHFNFTEASAIAVIYLKLQRDAGLSFKENLPIQSFIAVLHKAFGMPDESFFKLICTALGLGAESGSISLKVWMDAMSLFLRGSLKEKIEFCFGVYDVSGKSVITRENAIFFYRKCFVKHRDEELSETVKDFSDIVIEKLDLDKDGKISFEDYSKSVENDPMLLECFGQCLPDRRHVYAFLITFTDKIDIDNM